jgi:hypothetical protein
MAANGEMLAEYQIQEKRKCTWPTGLRRAANYWWLCFEESSLSFIAHFAMGDSKSSA